MDIIKKSAHITPSPRQMSWQKIEFYGFLHYGLNTYTGKEWGSGNEDPALFNPSDLDTDQWVETLKSGGMRGAIITAKHHDGFCLWPSSHTDYSVKSSPWKEGGGDCVRDLAESCEKAGMKLGIYLSPWDRHDSRYGTDEYNDFFKAQLRELLTGYGPIFCVWFDGACGEGKNGKKQVYDWDGYYSLIRELQPGAVISVVGPDVRWCGNEAGHCRPSEWSVVPADRMDPNQVAAASQQEDSGKFITDFSVSDDDIGSRERIRKTSHLIWYPAETDTSIRPNWFFRKSDNNKVKSLRELFNLYCTSVGGNSALLLNIPPDKRGLIHEIDAERLGALGDSIRELHGENLLAGSRISGPGIDENSKNLIDDNSDSFWSPPRRNEEQWEILFDLPVPKQINTILIMEYIEQGQRIEEFSVEALVGDKWDLIYKGTIVGYKKICRIRKIRTTSLRLTILSSRDTPAIRSIAATLFDKVPPISLFSRMRIKWKHYKSRRYEIKIKKSGE